LTVVPGGFLCGFLRVLWLGLGLGLVLVLGLALGLELGDWLGLGDPAPLAASEP